jgi:hypothetical protein
MQVRVFEGVGVTLPDAIYNAWRTAQDAGASLTFAGVITDLVAPGQAHDGLYHYVITVPWSKTQRRSSDAISAALGDLFGPRY